MSKGRILVVDDEEDILELVKYNLEREGYLVDCVGTGEEAIERAAAIRPTEFFSTSCFPEWTASKSAANCARIPTPAPFRSS